MIDEELKIIRPDLVYQHAYLRYCEAFLAAGEPLHPLDHLARSDFPLFVQTLQNAENMIGLPAGFVPYTIYWLVKAEGKVVGVGKLRHYLTPDLEDQGGHIGYQIHPQERRKGYATFLLRLILEEARRMGMNKVMLTCDTGNIASVRVIEKHGGVLTSQGASLQIDKEVSRYWIDISQERER